MISKAIYGKKRIRTLLHRRQLTTKLYHPYSCVIPLALILIDAKAIFVCLFNHQK